MKNNPVQNIVRDVVTSYVTTSQVLLVVSILGIGSICSTPAHAATFNYSGNTTGAPTFDRGGGSNSVFPYDVFSFNVDVGGSYSGSTELAMQVQLLKCHDNMLLI